MGKWDRRWMPRRRYNSNKYRDYDYEEPPPLPPSPHHPQSNPPPLQENNCLTWEIDFCKSVRVPWKKILAAKNFMYCYESVVKWDDSAAEEAFHDAKSRYWEKINCLPCETPLPDKDMYIDEINWNSYIDPKLISNLDREYFNPDDVEKAGTSQTSVEEYTNPVSVCVPVQKGENPDELPWGSDAAQGVDPSSKILHWGENTKSIVSKAVTNLWEQSSLVDKSLRNRKGSADKDPIQDARNCWVLTAKSIDSGDLKNPWERSHVQFDESSRNNTWKGSRGEDAAEGVRTQLGQNAKSRNSKDVNNPWERSLSQFDESMTKGSAGVDPQGLRGLNSNSISLEDISNPWEQSRLRCDDSLKNNAWKGSAGKSPAKRVVTHFSPCAGSINPKDVTPWEQSHTPVDESLQNNSWKGCPEESWRWRNPWEQICAPVDESLLNNAWKDCPEESWRWRKDSRYNKWSTENARNKRWVHVDDRSGGQKQWNISSHKQRYTVNTENNWQRSFPLHNGGSWGSRGRAETGNYSRDWKQTEIPNKQSKNVNNNGPFGGGLVDQSGCRKREGSLQHSPRHKTTRFQGDTQMTSQKW